MALDPLRRSASSGSTGSPGSPGSTGSTGIRIGDVEREQAVQSLGEHLRAGRLTVAEYDERLEQAFAARTEAELTPLFADLPGGSPRSGPTPPPLGRSQRRPHRTIAVPIPLRLVVILALITVALIVGAVIIFPPLLFIPLLWFVVIRRFGWYRGYGPHRHYGHYRRYDRRGYDYAGPGRY